jgi:hypothetical protein
MNLKSLKRRQVRLKSDRCGAQRSNYQIPEFEIQRFNSNSAFAILSAQIMRRPQMETHRWLALFPFMRVCPDR